MKRPHRILILIPASGIGGIATGLLGVLKRINRSRYHMIIVALQNGPVVRLIRKSGFRCTVLLPSDRLFHLKRLIVREKIELIQSCDAAAAEGILAARQLGLPHLYYAASNIERAFKGPSKKTLREFRNLIGVWSESIIVPSKALAKDVFFSMPKNKVHIIPWGVENHIGHFSQSRKEMKFKNSTKSVGMAANFYPAKGHLDFLKMASEIHKRMPEYKFVIAGSLLKHPVSVAYKKQVVRKIRRLKLEKIVQITKFSPHNRNEFFRRLDVLVIPSYEGMSQAMLEAGINRIPIVAVHKGGVTEVIEHEKSGLLTPLGNPKKMAQMVMRALKTPRNSRRLGREIRRRVLSSFTADQQSRKFEELYKSVLAKTKINRLGAL